MIFQCFGMWLNWYAMLWCMLSFCWADCIYTVNQDLLRQLTNTKRYIELKISFLCEQNLCHVFVYNLFCDERKLQQDKIIILVTI